MFTLRHLRLHSTGQSAFAFCLALTLVLCACSKPDLTGKQVIADLDAMTFPTPMDKLTYMRAETSKIEKRIIPRPGTHRDKVEELYGRGHPMQVPRGYSKFVKSRNDVAYELVSGTFLVVHYEDNRVNESWMNYLYYQIGDQKTYADKKSPSPNQPDEEEFQLQLADAHFNYVASQILYRIRFKTEYQHSLPPVES
jgi:hypothetical protein